MSDHTQEEWGNNGENHRKQETTIAGYRAITNISNNRLRIIGGRTNDVNHSIAGGNVGGHDLWHHITTVATALLKGTIDTISSTADRSTVLSIGHFDQRGAHQVFREEGFVDDMKQQNVGQQSHIVQGQIQQVGPQGLKGLVGRGKDSPTAIAQGIAQSSRSDSSAQGREIIRAASDFGFVVNIM
jgi:hypothetical protein